MTSAGQPSILRVLTGVQNVSALVFTAFATVHLAVPAVAAFGGIHAGNQVQLLGRAYYLPLEPALVYGPLILHASASILRRAVMVYRTKAWPKLNLHTASGYALIPFILHHVATHRLIPASSSSPINSLSPSELDLDFVAYGLTKWPVMSWVTYSSLVVGFFYHTGVGLMRVAKWLGGTQQKGIPTPFKSKTGGERKRIGMPGTVAIFSALVLGGLARIQWEGTPRSQSWGVSMDNRYQAVYKSLPGLYR